MTELPKLFLEALKSGKVYAFSIAVSSAMALFSPWEPLRQKEGAVFWLAMAFIFCCSFLGYSLIAGVWNLVKSAYVAGARNRAFIAKLRNLHPIEKAVLLVFAKTKKRFIVIPAQESEPDLERHLSHLYSHGFIDNYHGVDGAYRAAGPTGYKCAIEDRLWDIFAEMSYEKIQKLFD